MGLCALVDGKLKVAVEDGERGKVWVNVTLSASKWTALGEVFCLERSASITDGEICQLIRQALSCAKLSPRI